MIETDSDQPALAIRCIFLSREGDPGRSERTTPMCEHPVRDGKACVGPFLEDLVTNCGLWEPHPQSHLIPPPQPERWQRRRRREGFDMTRGWQGDWT